MTENIELLDKYLRTKGFSIYKSNNKMDYDGEIGILELEKEPHTEHLEYLEKTHSIEEAEKDLESAKEALNSFLSKRDVPDFELIKVTLKDLVISCEKNLDTEHLFFKRTNNIINNIQAKIDILKKEKNMVNELSNLDAKNIFSELLNSSDI